MNRIQKSLLLVAVIALPAAAHSAFAPKDAACFASGATTYQIAHDAASPDFRIRIDGGAQNPDLRMRLVDRAETADFVLVDDFSAGPTGACRSSTRIKTVKLDAEAPSPDVTVALSAGAGKADYTLYVHSVRYSQQDAAALLAAMWKTDKRREITTGSIR